MRAQNRTKTVDRLLAYDGTDNQRTLQFREMEHQLREREEQYRSVFEATGDGLFVIDLDGFIVEANPAEHTGS